MNIPKQVTAYWSTLKENGDKGKIVERLAKIGIEVHPQSVTRAYGGVASEDIFRVMIEFYRERQELINSAVPTL